MSTPQYQGEATCPPVKLCHSVISGHSHRVELLLSLLNVPYSAFHPDVRSGQQKDPDFLKLKPFRPVPVIDDNGIVWD